MLRDVFYYGNKPNAHPREQFAENLEDARQKATTRDFWIINEFCDYRNFDWDFDFEFLPDEDVWAEDHNNVWPSQHQKDSGTWLCPKEFSDLIIYRADVDPVIRRNLKNDNWVELDLIDHTKFDFSWHPDPTDPPFIYKWGCKFFPAELKHVLEYRVPGATQEKYMDTIVELLPETDRWVEVQAIDKNHFDMSWRPSPLDPPYIYIWGNKYIDGRLKSTLEYHCEGATNKKYMPELLPVLPEWDKWVEVQSVDKTKFDFSWRPDPREPAYIYTWGNKYIDAELRPTLEYHCEGATDRKYLTNDVPVLPEKDRWKIVKKIEEDSFDFSWRPDPREPPMTYVFGNTLYDGVKMPTIIYTMPEGHDTKYVDDIKAKLAPVPENYEHLEDSYLLDYSWQPDPDAPPYIYVWGNQWNKPEDKISVQYVVPGATEYKYMTERAIRRPCMDNWLIPDNIDTDGFDLSWEPDAGSPPYIYEFATVWNNRGGPRYVVEGATKFKFIEDVKAKTKPVMNCWKLPAKMDLSSFDFSWVPHPDDPNYIYEFGTQWQKTGGPRYVLDDPIDIKYVDVQKAKILPNQNDSNWHIVDGYVVKDFDYSWHPDSTEEPYIYVFGNNLYPAEESPTIEYVVPGATKVKYVHDIVAVLGEDRTNWEISQAIDEDKFDFSWKPNPKDPPYIYRWGNKYIAGVYRPTIDYVVPGATEIKYMNDDVIVVPEYDKWEIPDNLDTTGFDFTWRPDPLEPDQIYQFGTQWAKTGGPRYVVEGATDVKYIDTQTAIALPDKKNFVTMSGMKIESFDYSWHPDATEEPYIYVFGNQWNSAEKESTIEYRMPMAINKKYINDIVATVAKDMTNWEIPDNVNVKGFDFSWRPDPYNPPYIYEFGTQWAKTGGPKYVVEGAIHTKYIDVQKAQALPNKKNFVTMNGFKIESFDYSWHPDATEEPYIYVFGNQWYSAETESTIEYRMPGAINKKYINDVVATLTPSTKNWIIPDNIDVSGFDFSWHPDPYSPPYIYEFGTQWAKTGGPKYIAEGATTTKYIDVQKALALPNQTKNFVTMSGMKVKSFDYSWHPDSTDEPFIYVFGNQWFSAEQEPTIEYRMPGATEKKYVSDIVATLAADTTNWEVPSNIDVSSFDFSWRPDPHSPAYIYQFGTKLDNTDGPRYITPDNNGEVVYLERVEVEKAKEIEVARYFIETTLEDLVKQHPDEVFWAMRKNIDYTNFDFDWQPESLRDLEYVHVFGSPDSELTQTYYVSGTTYLKGNTQLKFVENTELDESYLAELFVKPDMFYVDRGNPEAAIRFEALKAKFGDKIQKTRYLNSWVDTIKRCTNRATSEVLWVLNSELDYTNFNFNYYPNPWQMKMVHVFGTQWSHWGTTFMVNRETFAEDTKYINIIEHLSNLNFVKDIRAKATQCVHDIVLIDHGNNETETVYQSLVRKAGNRTVTTVKYQGSYFNTLKKIIAQQQAKKENYIWVCSSVCDYSDFDFSYIIDPFSRDNLHVFPSGMQKFGDTFFFDVNQTSELINDLESLEEHKQLNFNQTVKTQRLPEPIIVVSDDTHTNAVHHVEGFPYATLITEDNKLIENPAIEPMNLWSPERKNIIVTSTGATRIVVPAEAKEYVKKELYDYPYIKRAPKLLKSNPLDIVYLSNGETKAEENWEHLLKVTENLPNRVVRVDGVNGRAKAYHAAAEASETPWMFTVFAKLKVNNKFDWNWQPDRMQSPKHYIFHAKNPVNGLIYGHQAMIAYNKKLTLANEGKGLDFTLDDEHEIVPLVSGTAHYNTDPFSTWRTAFREVIKLKADTTDESKERLHTWLTTADGDYSEYSIKGSNDAAIYYDEVDGDFDKLKLSYEWAWLQERFNKM